MHEKITDEVVSILTELAIACEREQFPKWGYEALEVLKGDYESKVRQVISLI